MVYFFLIRHGDDQLIVIAEKGLKSGSKNKGVICDHCGLTVKSKNGLKIHMKTHLDLTCGVSIFINFVFRGTHELPQK